MTGSAASIRAAVVASLISAVLVLAVSAQGTVRGSRPADARELREMDHAITVGSERAADLVAKMLA
ncbi:MAG: hypothetical protein CVV51_02970, partial [Spirochaetae bacterium HGW-Spirochaetae-7]